MAIIYCDADKTLTIQTRSTTYQMRIGRFGVLEHLYYGKKIAGESMGYLHRRADISYAPAPNEAGADRTYSLDTVSQEYPSCGVGDFRICPADIRQADGSLAADFRYVSYEIDTGLWPIPGLPAVYENQEGQGETLTVTLKDKVTDLYVDLIYGVLEQEDMITRSARFRNEGAGRVWLEKAHSASLDIPYGSWEMIHFQGRHVMERMPERMAVPHGVFSVGSKRGTSSHQHNPAVILLSPSTTEEFGQCYGAALMYSGEFSIDTELDQMGQVRMTMGIGQEQFAWALDPGARFDTPQVLMTFSDHGLAELSHRFHRAIRTHVCRGEYKMAKRPVLINNWEATYFQFDDEIILKIASQAAKLGIDMMVLDDGWFGKRNDDLSGLGDWTVNRKKLKNGLEDLVDKINAMGMRFGLWFEPEMISEDSCLYRAHPEWALQIPGRGPARGRMQLVLDMGRQEVQDYLYNQISDILDHANVEYVKWDFNRSICDAYSGVLPADRQGEVRHRFVLGIYALLERLTEDYPQVLFEGCSGGGGRFDAGMLYYTPQIWCSDDTDAIERLEIQYGTSFFYPVSAVGSHVSACPNHQTGRTTPLFTRAVVAMAGTFGYELDLNLLSDNEKLQVKEQVERFHEFDSLIHNGDYYRLAGPYDNKELTAWEFAAADGSQALVNLVVTHVRGNWLAVNIRLKGLNPDKKYTLHWIGAPDSVRAIDNPEGKALDNDLVIRGDALMYGGISMPMLQGDYPALQIYVKQI